MKNNSLSELDSASKRLKYVIETLGVKQSRMASKLGLSPSGMHYILNNEIKFSKNVKKIADYLNVNESWLLSGQGEIYNENTSIKTYKIPIYYPDQLKLELMGVNKTTITIENHYITFSSYTNRMLAIYMSTSEYSPKFEIGDIVAFEESANFDQSEYVLVFNSVKNELSIKKIFQLNEEFYFISAPHEKITKYSPSNGDQILGAYRECLKRHQTNKGTL